ncbi:hypothetical protein V6Z11_A11G236600 [Gossypium hirsutum]
MARIHRASSTAKDFEFVDFDFQVSMHLPQPRPPYPNQFSSTFQPPKCPWWLICFSRLRPELLSHLTAVRIRTKIA